MTFSLEVKGLAELQRKFEQAPQIVGEEMRTAMTQAVIEGQNVARERAPVDTGRLRSSIATELRGALPQLRGVIGTNVAPYPEILELSGRTHYRRGPRAGQPTAGWLSGTLPLIAARVEHFFERAAQRIAERLNA